MGVEPYVAEFSVRTELASLIRKLLKEKKLKQREEAELLGIDQPKVSKIRRGLLTGFSTERLLRLLHALDQDVVISVRRKVNEVPAVRVVFEG